MSPFCLKFSIAKKTFMSIMKEAKLHCLRLGFSLSSLEWICSLPSL